jgi:hypothetical protein
LGIRPRHQKRGNVIEKTSDQQFTFFPGRLKRPRGAAEPRRRSVDPSLGSRLFLCFRSALGGEGTASGKPPAAGGHAAWVALRPMLALAWARSRRPVLRPSASRPLAPARMMDHASAPPPTLYAQRRSVCLGCLSTCSMEI